MGVPPISCTLSGLAGWGCCQANTVVRQRVPAAALPQPLTTPGNKQFQVNTSCYPINTIIELWL
jgi:hypothetical protein